MSKTTNEKKYTVYLHVFPDGKKYVGCTCTRLRNRWNGGIGYESQSRMFSAILKFGWNNIRHYILFDGLSKEEALLYEAAFIREWKTYRKSKGYNSVSPIVPGADEINVPTFRECQKIRVDDIYEKETAERIDEKYFNHYHGKTRAKKVRCIETGEIFKDAHHVAAIFVDNGRVNNVYSAIRHGSPLGICDVYYEEMNTTVTRPAHWEFVD